MVLTKQKDVTYDQLAEAVIELGNSVLDADESADVWEVASGIMAGAVQFWLDSRQPCKEPFCGACIEIGTPERRLTALLNETRNLAEECDCYMTAIDVTAGTA